ncbi:hypothetical protein LAC81_34720 (plasmid) [Ensifer adhaerens]|uniref:hypothetical protein n=1 Tax=Ensifer adhaerens TaxID=106592 RepID=UPI001CBB5CE1|nr:hypothetical protein [Ensifer adhaerens]MBZ7927113.1 hypothetical protein [Ensifer adhaerens]UAX98155.1 hypothetical protein LAC78_36020 [Ensifer adhaerens]UAY05537.1 hypothetical protein LAC80_34725 [Ensifer adhaerens]UAY12915.1 hypothetical protein LAC81_34720 [Ensifer adhaerens]
MSRKLNAEKAQKMNLMLAQAVTAMRVNERLTCVLIRWAASHSEDPGFIERTLEEARNDLRGTSVKGSKISTVATEEALDYLDDLAIEIDAARRLRKRAPRKDRSEGIDGAAVTSADGSPWQK